MQSPSETAGTAQAQREELPGLVGSSWEPDRSAVRDGSERFSSMVVSPMRASPASSH